VTKNAKSAQPPTQNPTQYQKRDRGAKKREKKALKQVEANIAKPQNPNPPKFQYLCTVCNSLVFKRGVYTAESTASEGTRKQLNKGLGKWKCVCGNTKVRQVKAPVLVEQKAAA
jgi:hypothetical protein